MADDRVTQLRARWALGIMDFDTVQEDTAALLAALAAAEQAQDALRLRAENAEQDRDTLRRDLARAGQAVRTAEQRAARLGALEAAARAWEQVHRPSACMCDGCVGLAVALGDYEARAALDAAPGTEG